MPLLLFFNNFRGDISLIGRHFNEVNYGRQIREIDGFFQSKKKFLPKTEYTVAFCNTIPAEVYI